MLRLARLRGPIDPAHPHARFLEDVVDLGAADPLETLDGLSRLTGLEPGVLARYVITRWASDGPAAVMALGPRVLAELLEVVRRAEAEDTDAARLAAFERVRVVVEGLALARDRPDPT